MKRHFIRPSLLGMLLLVSLFVTQVSCMRVSSEMAVHGPDGGAEMTWTEAERSYGLPPVLTFTSRGPTSEEQGPESMRIEWAIVALSLLVWWCITMPIGRWITGYVRRDGEYAGPQHRGWRHPAAIVGCVLVGCLIVGLICAVVYKRTLGAPVPFGEMVHGFMMIFMIFAVPITLIVMIVRRWMHRSRVQQRGFAVENVGTPVQASVGIW